MRSEILLQWYDRHQRRLPWRALPGIRQYPYKVWLSEIMLQQTTVVTVKTYFENFIERWPVVEALAAAGLDEVLNLWQGLGYYARARNLHRCAQIVATDHAGQFPSTEAALISLPGIGPYTAAAIAAIAFDRKATPVDGNVERVMARLHLVKEPLPKAKVKLRELARTYTPSARTGDYAQAVMDLGATICTPRNPSCCLCPWSDVCIAGKQDVAGAYPKRIKKKAKPTRRGTAFLVTNQRGEVLLRKRQAKGLLGGMIEVPSSSWLEGKNASGPSFTDAPVKADWRAMEGTVRHTFTHFHLELTVLRGEFLGNSGNGPPSIGGIWCAPESFGDHALPTLMKKIIRHGLGEGAV